MRSPIGSGWQHVMLEDEILVPEQSINQQRKLSFNLQNPYFGTYWARKTIRETLSDQSAIRVRPYHLYNDLDRVIRVSNVILS